MAIDIDAKVEIGRLTLFIQGLVTAVSNPKGWGFMIALLPPFISTELPIVPQMLVLLSIITLL